MCSQHGVKRSNIPRFNAFGECMKYRIRYMWIQIDFIVQTESEVFWGYYEVGQVGDETLTYPFKMGSLNLVLTNNP